MVRTRGVVAFFCFLIVAMLSHAQVRGSISVSAPARSSLNSGTAGAGWHTPVNLPLRSMSGPRTHRGAQFGADAVTPAVCSPFAGCFHPAFIGTPSRHSPFSKNQFAFFGPFAGLWPFGFGYGSEYPEEQQNENVSTEETPQGLTALYEDQRRELELERQIADQRAADARSNQATPATQAAASPKTPESSPSMAPAAFLVLRDGRRLQVQSYLVTRNKIYTVGSGVPPVLLVSELDLPATMKANQEAGINFVLPGATR